MQQIIFQGTREQLERFKQDLLLLGDPSVLTISDIQGVPQSLAARTRMRQVEVLQIIIDILVGAASGLIVEGVKSLASGRGAKQVAPADTTAESEK
jgi:hypothetical protein